jgi:hypothetical protein
VVGGSLAALRSRDDLLKQADSPRYSLILQDAEAARGMGAKLPYGAGKGEYPAGRGFLIKSVRAWLTQVALPYDEVSEKVEEALDGWVDRIQKRSGPRRAAWRVEIEPDGKQPEAASGGGAGTSAAAAFGLSPEELAAMDPDVREEFLRQMKAAGVDVPEFAAAPPAAPAPQSKKRK